MKRTPGNRGLYGHIPRRTPETSPDLLVESKCYLFEAQARAVWALKKAGIDTSTLFEPVELPDGSTVLRVETIKPNSLEPAADHALHVMKFAHSIHEAHDLWSSNTRAALWRGRRMAEELERMKANQAWYKPAAEGMKALWGRLKAGKRKKETMELEREKWQLCCDEIAASNRKLTWSAIQAKVGAKHGVSSDTIKRRCKNPLQK